MPDKGHWANKRQELTFGPAFLCLSLLHATPTLSFPSQELSLRVEMQDVQ